MLLRVSSKRQSEQDELKAELTMKSWQHTCTICGKEFWVSNPTMYTYRDSITKGVSCRWFCSYTCSRAGEKKPQANKRGEKCILSLKKYKSRGRVR